MFDKYITGLGAIVLLIGFVAGVYCIILVDNVRFEEYNDEIQRLEHERDTYKQLVLDKFIEE
jgi:hypothetical protein